MAGKMVSGVCASLLFCAPCHGQHPGSGMAGGMEAPTQKVNIPGPLRAFERIAAISPEAPPEEVLPLLGYSIFQHGYVRNKPTEYLLILQRYVEQARELQVAAGGREKIQIDRCADAAGLLQILGYRMRGSCGTTASLETADPSRAFVTVDSGFPLTDLEDALQRGVPFSYPYPSSRLPLLFREDKWMGLRTGMQRSASGSLDVLLGSPAAARLYSALSRMDAETARYLERSLGLNGVLPLVAALDFYGEQLRIRDGRVVVPGGDAAEPAWRSLAGADAGSPAKFVEHLLSKDDGWLAAYFDVLSRLHRNERAHLTQPDLLVGNYAAFRGADLKRSALTGVTRSGVALLALDTRLSWESNGEPHVPGGLDVWRQILNEELRRGAGTWARRSRSFDHPAQLLEAMTAFTRENADGGPLQLYLTLSEVDRRRPAGQGVSADTAATMAAHFASLRDWYPIFSEFPGLDDRSIERFIQGSQAIAGLHGEDLRANAMGGLQANLGLWQILARQGEIPAAQQNATWQQVIAPFLQVSSSTQLFDGMRASFQTLLSAAGAPERSEPSTMLEVLAGPPQSTEEGQRVRNELVSRMRTVLEDQRLVSLDTLFSLSDGMTELAKTPGKANPGLMAMASELKGFELPRPIFTSQEKIEWAPGVYASHHAELQVQTDLNRVLTGPATNAQIETARGQLTPFLRDTLVGLNYAYYEPPGAQILHVNSLFVRTHDFLGTSVVGADCMWKTPQLSGVGVSAGGGAYLMGSLADLPYSLASAEAAFVVPEHIQALVWELIPSLLADSTVPRWWHVSADELHAMALYQQTGEELMLAAKEKEDVRAEVLETLSDQVSPRRFALLERGAKSGTGTPGMSLMPSEALYLAEEFLRRFPQAVSAAGPAGQQLTELKAKDAALVNPGRLSADFGVSHLTLARTNARELLHMQPFPFSTGSTNRTFAESLESDNLYWARLADEAGYSPLVLNRLVPELTRHMVGKIFASNMDDWPAVLRAMQQTREDLREGKIAGIPPPERGSLSQQAGDANGGNRNVW